jgi:hypothetical protein
VKRRAWAWVGLLLAAVLGFAQERTSSLAGSIFDELGGPVIAAKLSLHGDGSQLYLTRTTEQGTFQFPRMEPGKYTLEIDQAGFCKMEVPGIAVVANQKKSLPRITLKVPPEGQECE